MIYKHTKKNKFGEDTWHVKLDSLFHIFISKTNNNSFLVEIKEYRWVTYKTRKSYMSESGLEKTIADSFQEMQDYLNGTGKYHWSDKQKKDKLTEVLSVTRDYGKAKTKISNQTLNDSLNSQSHVAEKP